MHYIMNNRCVRVQESRYWGSEVGTLGGMRGERNAREGYIGCRGVVMAEEEAGPGSSCAIE
jgi:hypothetical protein